MALREVLTSVLQESQGLRINAFVLLLLSLHADFQVDSYNGF